MTVYVIRAGEHGPVKIGYAEDVHLRLVKMQADNHERLTILRLFVGGEVEEKQLHDRFADSRLHGEWFAYTRLMEGDLCLEETTDSPKPPSRRAVARKVAVAQSAHPQFSRRLRSARRDAGLTQRELAECINSDYADISHYENGSYSPSLKKLTAIASALGVTAGWLMGEPERAP